MIRWQFTDNGLIACARHTYLLKYLEQNKRLLKTYNRVFKIPLLGTAENRPENSQHCGQLRDSRVPYARQRVSSSQDHR